MGRIQKRPVGNGRRVGRILKILEEPIEETEKHFIPISAFDVKWERLTEEEKEEYNKRQSEYFKEI